MLLIPKLWASISAICLYVYKDKDQPPLPEGVEVLMECPKELISADYFGMAFIRNIVPGEIMSAGH